MKDIDKVLADLHEAVARTLLGQVQDNPDVDPKVIKVAIEFLKDNGVDSNVKHNPDLAKLMEEIPEYD